MPLFDKESEPRAHVRDDAWNRKHGDHGDVGGTGGEGLDPPWAEADLHDGGKDVDIDKDNQGGGTTMTLKPVMKSTKSLGCVCTVSFRTAGTSQK